jgi:tetratricopeptide (TPR) repeat protein
LGESDKAIDKLSRAIELEKNSASLYYEHARNLITKRDFVRAEQEMAKAARIQPKLPQLDYLKAMYFAARGEREKALHTIGGVERSYQYCITCAYSLLGMIDEAIQNIELGIDVGFEQEQHYLYSSLFLEKNPCFDNLRDDPRFLDILESRKAVHEERINEVKSLLRSFPSE